MALAYTREIHSFLEEYKISMGGAGAWVTTIAELFSIVGIIVYHGIDDMESGETLAAPGAVRGERICFHCFESTFYLASISRS